VATLGSSRERFFAPTNSEKKKLPPNGAGALTTGYVVPFSPRVSSLKEPWISKFDVPSPRRESKAQNLAVAWLTRASVAIADIENFMIAVCRSYEVCTMGQRRRNMIHSDRCRYKAALPTSNGELSRHAELT